MTEAAEAETEAESHYKILGIAHSNRRYTYNIKQILFRESHDPLAMYTYLYVIYMCDAHHINNSQGIYINIFKQST